MTTNGDPEFVRVIAVGDLKPGAPPIDVTTQVRAVRPNAIARILTRLEDKDTNEAPGTPRFFSIARTCSHAGCDILRGGTWGFADTPKFYDVITQEGTVHAVIECPCHGSRFNVTNGMVLRKASPTTGDIAQFQTKVEKDESGELSVFVAIDPEVMESPVN